MLILAAKIRKDIGKKAKFLGEKGLIPAVLYGSKTKNTVIEISSKDFEKIYREAGESSLVNLDVEGKKFPVLIHEVQKNPITEKFIHVDFFQPDLDVEIVAKVPLIYEGLPPAVKDLGGTFIKNLSELDVKALPQNLPHEIRVDISGLITFDDNILVKDLKLPDGVKVLKEKELILAFVAPLKNIEEELVKPVEENVEGVEKVEKPKKDKVEDIEPQKGEKA